ncbi:MAG: twin-arginine translocation signal domain-containing protein, partial [Thermoguttaceae bacterium]|nr:twin-arginine translocation signal domain-containing protein [Thermoguttaceae bacterium]
MTTRRDFLKQSGGVLAGAALASAISARSYAAEDNTIKVALVGCGGRGTGAAANALATTSGPTKLVAMADVFDSRLKSSLNSLTKQFPEQVDVPPERQFDGLDGYKKAIDCLSGADVVLLTTPPAFRP